MGLTFLISPVAGLCGAFTINFAILKAITLHPPAVANARAVSLSPYIVFTTVCVSSMSLTLAGPLSIHPVSKAIAASLGIGLVVAVAWPRLTQLLVAKNDGKKEDASSGDIEADKHEEMSFIASAGSDAKESPKSPQQSNTHVTHRNDHPKSHSTTTEPERRANGDKAAPAEAGGKDGAEPEKERLRAARRLLRVEQLGGVEETFTPLLVFSGLVVAFAHGSNDVSNAAGPLGVIIGFAQHPHTASIATVQRPFWSNVLAALAFVFGIILIGGKTITLVGCKLAKQTASKAFATQFGAACTILMCSLLKQTVSTSHVLVGAVVGASLAEKAAGLPDASDVDLSVLGKIVSGWIVTIPIAGCIAYACYFAVNIISGQW
jgi:phosphate/sulfate permease